MRLQRSKGDSRSEAAAKQRKEATACHSVRRAPFFGRDFGLERNFEAIKDCKTLYYTDFPCASSQCSLRQEADLGQLCIAWSRHTSLKNELLHCIGLCLAASSCSLCLMSVTESDMRNLSQTLRY